MIYPPGMDPECIELCDALNSIEGIKTTSSCCGHCINPFQIWFECDNFETVKKLSHFIIHGLGWASWKICLFVDYTGKNVSYELRGSVYKEEANRMAKNIMEGFKL